MSISYKYHSYFLKEICFKNKIKLIALQNNKITFYKSMSIDLFVRLNKKAHAEVLSPTEAVQTPSSPQKNHKGLIPRRGYYTKVIGQH